MGAPQVTTGSTELKQEGVSTRRRPCPSQVQNQGVTPSLPSECGHTVAPASGLRCPNKWHITLEPEGASVHMPTPVTSPLPSTCIDVGLSPVTAGRRCERLRGSDLRHWPHTAADLGSLSHSIPSLAGWEGPACGVRHT